MIYTIVWRAHDTEWGIPGETPLVDVQFLSYCYFATYKIVKIWLV